MFKDILTKDYAQFFVDGFSLENLDKKLHMLNREDKAEMLGHVVAALDMDLKASASPQKGSLSPNRRPALPEYKFTGIRLPHGSLPPMENSNIRPDDNYSDCSFESARPTPGGSMNIWGSMTAALKKEQLIQKQKLADKIGEVLKSSS